MNQEERSKRTGAYERMRGTMHIGMGVFYLIAGTLVLYVKYFGSIELPAGVAFFLGIMMLLYGIFRIWRGFVLLKQKNTNS